MNEHKLIPGHLWQVVTPFDARNWNSSHETILWYEERTGKDISLVDGDTVLIVEVHADRTFGSGKLVQVWHKGLEYSIEDYCILKGPYQRIV